MKWAYDGRKCVVWQPDVFAAPKVVVAVHDLTTMPVVVARTMDEAVAPVSIGPRPYPDRERIEWGKPEKQKRGKHEPTLVELREQARLESHDRKMRRAYRRYIRSKYPAEAFVE